MKLYRCIVLFFLLTTTLFADDVLISKLQNDEVKEITHNGIVYPTIVSLRDNGLSVLEVYSKYMDMNLGLEDISYAISIYCKDGKWITNGEKNYYKEPSAEEFEKAKKYKAEVVKIVPINISYRNWENIGQIEMEMPYGIYGGKCICVIYTTGQYSNFKWVEDRKNEKSIIEYLVVDNKKSGTFDAVYFHPYANCFILVRYLVDHSFKQIEAYEFPDELTYEIAVSRIYPLAPPRKYLTIEAYENNIFKGTPNWEDPR